MKPRSTLAFIAALVLLGLPVADFVRDGEVADTLVGALLIVAFGGGGFAADSAVKDRLRRVILDETEAPPDTPPTQETP